MVSTESKFCVVFSNSDSKYELKRPFFFLSVAVQLDKQDSGRNLHYIAHFLQQVVPLRNALFLQNAFNLYIKTRWWCLFCSVVLITGCSFHCFQHCHNFSTCQYNLSL